ncbi:MAG: glycosyltransferase [Fibrobacterales bacterium]
MTYKIILIALYGTSSLVLLAFAAQCFILSYLYLRKRKDKLAYHRTHFDHFDGITDTESYPLVCTQLPMYNEKAVAERLIQAVTSFDYPREKHYIQVLDDSTDETVAIIDEIVERYAAMGHWIEVIRRDVRTGFKAGALKYGLTKTDAEFVAIFDADFIPTPDFLKKSIPFFLKRPKLGLVQGRWDHINRGSSLLTRVQAMGIDGHFMVEQAARSWNNLFMNFNGTAGIFRITAIEAAGNWQADTLTEDMDLSYRMQLKGWEAEYVPDINVPAEIPEDINAFKNQQFRWAKGSIQTAKKILPLLMKSDIPKFKFFQAFFHLTHYSIHIFMLALALFTLPMVLLVHFKFSIYLYSSIIGVMLLSSLAPTLMYMISQHFLGNALWKKIALAPFMMVIGTGFAVNNSKAVFEALIGKESPFKRTPKKGDKKSHSYKSLANYTNIFELMLATYCLLSLYNYISNNSWIISPFLVIYTAGFFFVGMVSTMHVLFPGAISKSILFKER